MIGSLKIRCVDIWMVQMLTSDATCIKRFGIRNKMPFKSKAQQRYMFAKHPEIAKEFADATPNIKQLAGTR